jgi:eukaryotic-like serine/threonine-protein kinase
LQALFGALTGDMLSLAILITSAVGIGALFQPARRRLQRFVDVRFYGLAVDVDQLGKRGSTEPGALTGQRLGAYEVGESVGKGGMGEVYKGFQPALNRAVAIKVLPHHLAKQAEFRARFEREARTVSALKHPHIVNVFDFGHIDGTYYMVMDYVEGRELGHVLEGGGRLPIEVALTLLQDVAAALDYAHEQGLVHRDVKPSNILLRTTTRPGVPWQAVLTDFGVARVVDSTTRLTGTGMIGTLDYLAPEQISTGSGVTHQADIYSLGIVAFQMLTGRLPFEGSAAQVLFGHLHKPAPAARAIVASLPAAASDAISRALMKQPDQRFKSAGAFVQSMQWED